MRRRRDVVWAQQFVGSVSQNTALPIEGDVLFEGFAARGRYRFLRSPRAPKPL